VGNHNLNTFKYGKNQTQVLDLEIKSSHNRKKYGTLEEKLSIVTILCDLAIATNGERK
jgi:hypothetical protein